MEVVYHLFKSTGGAILEIKVQIPRSDPVVPSSGWIYSLELISRREKPGICWVFDLRVIRT